MRNQRSNQEIYHIINSGDKNSSINDSQQIITPPFYGNLNFILLNNSSVYFHTGHVFYFCSSGMDFSKPEYLSLTTDSIKEIQIENLSAFLNSLVKDSIIDERNFFACISSSTDTIRNSAFIKIKEFLRTKRIKLYNIRKWTEEEQYVLTAKIENKEYNPDKIKWKVGFGGTKFLPPMDTQ